MFTIHSGSNPTGDTNVIMGIVNGKTICFDVNNFDVNQKKVYTDFFGVVGSHATVILVDCPFDLNVDHVTKNDVASEVASINYPSLTQTKKTKIETAFNMFIAATENQ